MATFSRRQRGLLLALLLLPVCAGAATPVVRMSTTLGEIFLELTPEATPITVENFLHYVEEGAYDGSFVHRSDPGFVIQGGGYTFDEVAGVDVVHAHDPIIYEAGASNLRGTVAMARLQGQPDSATSQWFINLSDDNTYLDTLDGGYAVFGWVRGTGMAVADAIASLPVWTFASPFRELPLIDYPGSGNVQSENFVMVTAEAFELITPPLGAVLPTGRAVQVGQTASAFATLINTGTATAASCGLRPATEVPGTFSFQTTDATNTPVGTVDERVDLAAGAAQSFVFSFVPDAPLAETDVEIEFACGNADPATALPGVNTFLLSASSTPVPDVIALAATVSGDGIAVIPGAAGTGVFSVATVNVGAAGPVTVSADTGAAGLPVTIWVCETDPVSGACLADLALSVEVDMAVNETRTFSFFVQGGGDVPFDPAGNRAFARFRDGTGALRGATSVALRTDA